MTLRRYRLLSLLSLCLLTACSSTPHQPIEIQTQTRVEHIVVVWLREPGNESHRQALLEASQQLTRIPGIIFRINMMSFICQLYNDRQINDIMFIRKIMTHSQTNGKAHDTEAL